MMKITGLSHLFKWENLHNWWLTKYFFAPLYVQNAIKNKKHLGPIYLNPVQTVKRAYCGKQYVTLDHKTSHKGLFFFLLRFLHHMKAERYDYYLKIWNLRVPKNRNIEKIAFKVVQIKFLAMHITNQKLSFYIFIVGNLQNIFMEHDLYSIS